jgi:large subunit ribosomal protein L3
MKQIIGTKMGMMQLFDGASLSATPVTVIEALPNVVTQVKTATADGYSAVQIGFGVRRHITKPLRGHLKGLPPVRGMTEFRISETGAAAFKRGDAITVASFQVGDSVEVSGVSKGRGFQGVVKRHGFHGGPKSHGQKHRLRAPGSIGSTTPQRVIKGTRMAGRMGSEQVKVKGLKVVAIDAERNLLFVTGAVPGSRGSFIEVTNRS